MRSYKRVQNFIAALVFVSMILILTHLAISNYQTW